MKPELTTITFLLEIKELFTEIINYLNIISLLNRGSNYFKGIYHKRNLQCFDGNYSLTLHFKYIFIIIHILYTIYYQDMFYNYN